MPEYDATIQYKDIPEFPGYMAGTDGTIWSCWKQKGQGRGIGARYELGDVWRCLKPSPTSRGYLIVTLYRNFKSYSPYVHHLILKTFVGPCPPGKQCRHFPDRDKSNNNLENIQWGTRSENMKDKLIHGTDQRGEKCKTSKLNEKKVIDIRQRVKNGESRRDIAFEYSVSPATVDHLVTYKTWGHVQ